MVASLTVSAVIFAATSSSAEYGRLAASSREAPMQGAVAEALEHMPGDDLAMFHDCQCATACSMYPEGEKGSPTWKGGLHFCDVRDDTCMGANYGVAYKKNPALGCTDATGAINGNCRAACEYIKGRYDCWNFPCQNKGFCIDGEDSYKCYCDYGWEGDDCESNINECLMGAKPWPDIGNGIQPVPVCAHTSTSVPSGHEVKNVKGSLCVDSPGSYACSCAGGGDYGTGYIGNGYSPTAPLPRWMDVATGCHDYDDCASHPCANGGTCTDKGQDTQKDPSTFSCACATGWVGTLCQEDIDECLDKTHDCDVHAECTNNPGAWSCACLVFEHADGRTVGWEGDGIRLDSARAKADGTSGCFDINDCETFKPCMNGATCGEGLPGTGDYFCECAYGWTSRNCDVDENECENGVENCHADAYCTNVPGSWTCTCNQCWTGDGLACIDADDCEFSPCANGGTCTDVGECSYMCDCVIGWRGKDCEKDWNECTMGIHTCHDDAVCINVDGSFTCECDAGFSGDGFLECLDIDDCATWYPQRPNFPVPGKTVCAHGTCEDKGPNVFVCTCEAGWTDANCDMDINECQRNTDGCHKRALCINTVPGNRCVCNHGYSGDGARCFDIMDCNGATCDHGYCTDLGVDDFRCTCDDGWQDALCDFDIDECATYTHNCHDEATCTNSAGSFTCACNLGFFGDGVADCTDMDDCGSAPCEHGECYDKGSAVYGCRCEEGWRDYNCDYDINECYLGTHNCHIDGRCVNTPGGFYCRCVSGYEGDGYATTHVHTSDTSVDMFMERQCMTDDGAIKTCEFKEQNAYDKVAGKKPELVAGLTFLGFYLNTEHEFRGHVGKEELVGMNAIGCIDLDDCDPARDGPGQPDDPCDPVHGTCEDLGPNKFVCNCMIGWDSMDCSMDIDECMDGTHKCHANGVCSNTAGSHTCDCKNEFWGDGVECTPCTTCGPGWLERGICDFIDRTCTNVNECEDGLDNCSDKAHCADTVGSFTCTCMIEQQFWGNGVECTPCTTCGPGYVNEQDCTAHSDRVCKLDFPSGMYLIESAADGTRQCVTMSSDKAVPYPTRYNYGSSSKWCGAIPSLTCPYDAKILCQVDKLVKGRRSTWRITHITRDYFALENDAAGLGMMCLGFADGGNEPYPELMTWGEPGDAYCGFKDSGAVAQQIFLENKQAVWRIVPLNVRMTKILMQSRAADAFNPVKRGWQCMYFGNAGVNTNPSRPPHRPEGAWGHGGEWCGLEPEGEDDPIESLLKNRQAVFIVTNLCKVAEEANEKGVQPPMVVPHCPEVEGEYVIDEYWSTVDGKAQGTPVTFT